MLKLENIVKTYQTGSISQNALKGVTVAFRRSEFVCILGQSGSGKTTMLNIIGGLDRYTSGQMSIDGVLTDTYKERDWDRYRNRSVGFIFQSYNLIPHQSVLANVELAMTISGASKKRRRRHAARALAMVGLKEHMHKKPNQLSGGQMQRVAIARALVNDPDILLADEPTGALDSETSIQIMQLLQEIAEDRLVIMVTHNAELAEQYATRTVRLLDGQIVSDSDPYYETEAAEPRRSTRLSRGYGKKRLPKTSMSFGTALSLSFNNLRTKKGRTFLTAFAGSIGIIGIALILALSSGMQSYVSDIETDTLSSYPIIIESQAVDLSDSAAETSSSASESEEGAQAQPADGVQQSGFAGDTLQRETPRTQHNDLAAFKAYLDSEAGNSIRQHTSAVRYGYGLELQVYSADTQRITQINPSPVYTGEDGNVTEEIWTEMIGNTELLQSQYDLLAGSWPQDYHDVVLVLDENNAISDTAMYALGLKDAAEFEKLRAKVENGEAIRRDEYETASFSYDDLLGMEFLAVSNAAYYEEADGVWLDRRSDEAFMKDLLGSAETLRISGIIRPAADAAAAVIEGTVGYTAELTEHMIALNNDSAVVRAQKETPETNVFTGSAFMDTQNMSQDEVLEALPQAQRAQLELLPESVRSVFLSYYMENAASTYEGNLQTLGAVDPDTPSTVELYLRDFSARDSVLAAIDAYNAERRQAGEESAVIQCTDVVGTMISSVTDVIDMITYLLIGFVSISLVVSSIMIGIITYISVLERTKEIGVLRSLGASRRDISRVFNAETAIVGLAAGLIGVGATLLLSLPINAVIQNLSGVSGIASLPPAGALVLILVSVALTMIAGLIPAHAAAKKDPVTALRSE
ncbi:MAG TPA: ABC transporter ATP-binding protein/permease [Candidatus Scubalenecus merdavium]|uniref:ABC transporter ATP-binding protein/permease n=1 Tax=Candidatus Scybalenecus merdavium TaxID=2840939 RepID=A0A9D1MU00_9FIRM|nr:ABC transporter ATP-binding protein/permease [Candidatus Scubalenecus merdavium]